MDSQKEISTKGLPIHVTQVSIFECPRRILMTIIGLAKGVEFYSEENHFMLAGNILHGILQEIFKFNFGEIEYYYSQKDLTLEDAIYVALISAYENWKQLFNLQFPSALWVEHPDSIINVDEICEKQLRSLAKASSSLVEIKENKLESLVLGEEFQVNHKLRSGVVLTGRIDLLSRTSTTNKYRLIELKTGKRPKESDKNQIKLYGEIFTHSFPDYEVELELWYTQMKRKIIRKVELVEDESILSRVDTYIDKAKSVRDISELPIPGDPYGWCRYSNNCPICQKEALIFELDDIY